MAPFTRAGVVVAMVVAPWLSSVDARAEDPAPTGIVSPTNVVPLSLLLPRRAVAGRLEGVVVSKPVLHAKRLLATVTTPASPDGTKDDLLVCIDTSDTVEGRVEWTSQLPAGASRFDGSPWVERETVRAFVVADGPRSARLVATFDLFTGRHLRTAPADRPPGPGEGER